MKEPKIIHVLADGTRTDSIKGHVIPADNPVYKIIFEASKGETNK